MDKDKKVLASKACYDSNGGNANTCVLTFGKTTGTTFYLKIDSKHGTWNWMGQWKLNDGCVQYGGSDTFAFTDTGDCKPSVSVVSNGKQHSSSTTHGGHKENQKDAKAIFDGKMILWAQPNTYDVLYKLTYPQETIVDAVMADYDAGATLALLDANQKTILSKDCYASNGGRKNKCVLNLGGPGHTISGKTFFIKIDSKHGTWNWMGNIVIEDYCYKKITTTTTTTTTTTKKTTTTPFKPPNMSGSSGVVISRPKSKISFGPKESAILFHDASRPGELHFLGKKFLVGGVDVLKKSRRLGDFSLESGRIQELESKLWSSEAENKRQAAEIRMLRQQMDKIINLLAAQPDDTELALLADPVQTNIN